MTPCAAAYTPAWTLLLLFGFLGACLAETGKSSGGSAVAAEGAAQTGVSTPDRPPNKKAQKLIAKGLKHANSGDYAAAIPFYTQAIEADPGNNNVRQYRLNAYRGLKQTDLALQDCDAMIRVAPSTPVSYLNRGFVLQSAGRLDEALQDFERVKSLDPKNTAADASMANIFARKGQSARALECINSAIAAAAQPATGFILLRGEVHLQGNDYANAVRDFDTVLKEDGDILIAHYYRARALHLAGSKSEALVGYRAFHSRLSKGRVVGSKANQIATAIVLRGLIGAAMLLDDPPRGFTTSFDEMDVQAIKYIEELSGSKP